MNSADLALFIEMGFWLGIMPASVVMILGKVWRVIDIID